MKLVSVEELHRLTGATHRTARNRLAESRVEPVDRQGRSDLFDAEIALRAILAAPRVDSDDLDLATERAGLAKKQRLYYEQRRRKEAGEQLPRGEVMAEWSRMISSARQVFLSLPARGAPLAMGASDVAVAESRLRKIVYDALNEMHQRYCGVPIALASAAASEVSGRVGGEGANPRTLIGRPERRGLL